MLRPTRRNRELVCLFTSACGVPAPAPIFPSHDALHHRRTAPQDVLQRAKRFFAERVPNAAAFAEKEGPGFLVLRGQGGEEIALHAWVDAAGKTRVRALHPLLRSGAGSLSFRPSRSKPLWKSRDRGGCAVRRPGDGDRRVGSGISRGRAHDHGCGLERQALTQALKRAQVRPEDYVVKFHGAQLLDETMTLAALGAVPNSPFIVLPARRQPVR